MFRTLKDLEVGWSVTTPLYANVREAIAAIDEDAWTSIDYPQDGRAQVAETTISATHRTRRRERIKLRMVIRRTRIVGDQAQLWPDWRYHTFVTNLDQPTVETDQHHHPDSEHPTVETDRYHRHHASVELAIRDLKNSAGLTHLPSGRFDANAAWLLCASLAHNLYRWITQLGRAQNTQQLTVGQTIRTRLFGIPARIVNHSGRYLLRLPARWPWAKVYQTTLRNLRALPQRC